MDYHDPKRTAELESRLTLLHMITTTMKESLEYIFSDFYMSDSIEVRHEYPDTLANSMVDAHNKLDQALRELTIARKEATRVKEQAIAWNTPPPKPTLAYDPPDQERKSF